MMMIVNDGKLTREGKYYNIDYRLGGESSKVVLLYTMFGVQLCF